MTERRWWPQSGQMMLTTARIKAEAVANGGDPSAGSEYAERATAPLSEPALIGAGGEIVPTEALFPAPELRNTLENPTLVTADASRDRLHLLDRANALELGLDLADTINPQNTAELALAHQLAAAHQGAMKLIAQMNAAAMHAGSSDTHCARAARLAGAASRLMTTYQQGLLTLRQLRHGGKQSVTVTHIVQQVNVEDGGQAVVAGNNVKPRLGGRGPK
jgi:hypothetical protein